MNYKLISMDFDGTLLTSDKKVTEKTRNMLLEYKNSKHIIVGITARNLASVNNVCEIDLFDYLILNNGSYIYDVKNKDGINMNNIDKKMAINITNYVENIAEQIDYCSLNKYYIYKKEIVKKKDYLVQINNIDEVEEEISRMNIFLKSNEEIDKYKEIIENNFNNINVLAMLDTDNKSNIRWLVLNPKGTNKFKALKELCLRLNINVNEVIFFGDSTNDLPIINQVGLGVAMGNALQEVKEQAKEITLSNDEDGIAVFLENIKI